MTRLFDTWRHIIMRLAVLRMASTDLVYAKEPTSPVVLALRMTDPLSDLQVRHLSVAAPWNPIMVEAVVDDAWGGSGFGASISSIETLPRIPLVQPKRRLREGQFKRKRGFLFHD